MSRPLAIGLVFETFETYAATPGEPVDAHAEYEPIETVEVLEASIRVLGHEPVRIGSPRRLLDLIGRGELPRLDAALNIAEGHGSRNREGWAPALLEMAGVPMLGSDALTLSLTLDKAWALRTAAAAGLAVAPHCVVSDPEEARSIALPAEFPLFVKPRWEGTAKGIRRTSRVDSREALAREVARVVRDYDQPALIEAFVPGAEYTATVVGHAPARALPIVQRALDPESGIGLHAVEHGGAAEPDSYSLPGELTPELEAELGRLALAHFALFECRDFARLDFRLSAGGEPIFLEINPLPTFAPDGTFGIIAELEGRPLPRLLADVFGEALRRLGLPASAPGARVEPGEARG